MNQEHKHGHVVLALALVAETVATAYCALMAFLLSAWSAHEALAETFTSQDWWSIALGRLVVGLLVAGGVAATIGFINYLIVRGLSLHSTRVPRISAVLTFIVVFGAATAGALHFGFTKPSM